MQGNVIPQAITKFKVFFLSLFLFVTFLQLFLFIFPVLGKCSCTDHCGVTFFARKVSSKGFFFRNLCCLRGCYVDDMFVLSIC